MWRRIIWNEEPGGNHIDKHGLTIENVEYVPANLEMEDVSRSSGLPCSFGWTPEGRYIIVVYELADEDIIYPVTVCQQERC